MMAVFAVMAVALATTVAVQRSAFEQRREREQDLLFVGQQFRDAINHYAAGAASSPGLLAYPKTLDDLVEDHRSPATVRHLRRIYPDPMTGQRDWVLEKIQDRIVGVHSRSTATPIRHTGFLPEWEDLFARAHSYQEWRFVADAYLSGEAGSGAASAPLSSGAGANATSAGAGNDTNPATPDNAQPGAPPGPDLAALAQCQAKFGKAQRGACFAPGVTAAASQSCAMAIQQNLIECLQAASGQ